MKNAIIAAFVAALLSGCHAGAGDIPIGLLFGRAEERPVPQTVPGANCRRQDGTEYRVPERKHCEPFGHVWFGA